jgi:transposase
MATERTLIDEHPCPKCGERADWLEDRHGKIELGCVSNHQWTVDT